MNISKQLIYAAIAGLYLIVLFPVAAQADRYVAEAEETLLNPRSDTRERLDAIQILEVRLSNEQAAQLLGQALVNDPELRVRKAAASALWGHEQALSAEPQLFEALDDDPEVSVRAAGALHGAGIPAEQVAKGFRKGLGSSNRGTAYNASRGLIGVDPPASLLPGLLNYLDWRLQENDIQGAYSAQAALEELTTLGFDQLVFSGLTDYVELGAAGAAYALPALDSMPGKPVEYVTWLTTMSKADNKQVQEEAVRALGGAPQPSAATAVAAGLLDSSSEVQLAAIDACSNLRAAADPCVDQLAVLLRQSKDVEVRTAAAQSLASLYSDLDRVSETTWIAARDAALQDPEAEVREYAITAVADMPADASQRMVVLARAAAGDSVAYNKSRALARLARMVGYPGQAVPSSVYQDVEPLTRHEDSEVARLATLVMAAQ